MIVACFLTAKLIDPSPRWVRKMLEKQEYEFKRQRIAMNQTHVNNDNDLITKVKIWEQKLPSIIEGFDDKFKIKKQEFAKKGQRTSIPGFDPNRRIISTN